LKVTSSAAMDAAGLDALFGAKEEIGCTMESL
jgi:hypothetical protein